jgi:hypothetical protein
MFVKVTNGQIDQYPYTVGDLRRDNPNTSFPKQVPETTMARYGMFPVGYEAAPEYDPMTHRLQHSSVPEREVIGYYTEEDAPSPEMVGEPIRSGRWVLTKTVVALTPEQVADRDAAKGKEVRKKRNTLLADSDWTQVADAPVDATAWATYRQGLRDITDHVSFPYLTEEDWPVAP